MTTYLGIVSLGHDASVALINDKEIIFAGHAERYSREKNDGDINKELLEDCFSYGHPDEIIWYEKPILKASRQLYCGQYGQLHKTNVNPHLRKYGLDKLPFHTVGHHESHAAAGYFTSPFQDASILVCDAIGEWTCISIWKAEGNKMEKVWSQKYPHSLGLLYSAMTQRVGKKPNEEEYIMMGMAALGDKLKYAHDIYEDFIEPLPAPHFKLKENVHRGIRWWKPEIKSEQDFYDLAASMQFVTEMYLTETAQWIHANLPSRNLIMMGGVALNCVANSKVAALNLFNDIWIMPNPGDAGSSIGAVLAHTRQHVFWDSPYLGYDIQRPFNADEIADSLVNEKILAIANGRAEFGPRALGNRSLIADPRGPEIKDKVNQIKKREMFRPFAPVILEHLADKYFYMPTKTSPYMQFTAECKYPKQFPAICHFDGTSRVQTINESQNKNLFDLINAFYQKTGCPMILNTSLNIKGEPLVNTWEDALRFSHKYNVKLF